MNKRKIEILGQREKSINIKRKRVRGEEGSPKGKLEIEKMCFLAKNIKSGWSVRERE